MLELITLYILQVLTTFTFILLGYYFLVYISNKIKFKHKEPILAFKTAILAGSIDLFLTLVASSVNVNKDLTSMGLFVFEIAFFYLLVKEVYELDWKYASSLAFFLIVALFVAEFLVLMGMLAFLAMYASV